MGRRFELVSAYRGRGLELPRRHTRGSAGYDLAAAEDTVLVPGQVTLVPTGLKVYLPPGGFLAVYARSSLVRKNPVLLANGVGVIDADYADNPENEGHIMVPLWNYGQVPVVIARGERIAQGIFCPYQTTEDDLPGGERQGGFGSTGSHEPQVHGPSDPGTPEGACGKR